MPPCAARMCSFGIWIQSLGLSVVIKALTDAVIKSLINALIKSALMQNWQDACSMNGVGLGFGAISNLSILLIIESLLKCSSSGGNTYGKVYK